MITDFTRADYTFIIQTGVMGVVKIESALIGHIETAGKSFKLKLLDGTHIGTYDMANLTATDVISFNSNGVVKIIVYDMDDNILPCEKYTISDIDKNPVQIYANILIECIIA